MPDLLSRITGMNPRADKKKSIAIAITTHNRQEQLLALLESIRRHTDPRIGIAVFDDGSADCAIKAAKDLCDYYYKASSHGIAENKNRALFFWCEINPVRRILLLEDDLLITERRWLKRWKRAIDNFGHINYSFPDWVKGDESFRGGRGSPCSPYRWTRVTGQVTGVDAEILRDKVGYMNPVFQGFGHEHLEWTERWLSEGFGGKVRGGRRVYLALSPKGIGHQECMSTGLGFDTARNRDMHVNLRRRGHPRIFKPWKDEKSKIDFLRVFARNLVD
jgi:glycosyltransferase involved in cell wall biosynthesis